MIALKYIFFIFLIRKCKAPEFYKYCLKSKVNVTYLEITADLKIYILCYMSSFFYHKDEIKFLYIIISISVRIGKEM